MVSLQFSVDNQFILTSVTHAQYQELILWDLPNFRYMRDNVKLAADRIEWHDSICSGSEDVRAIWENSNIGGPGEQEQPVSSRARQLVTKRLPGIGSLSMGAGRAQTSSVVVNLSCHRLLSSAGGQQGDEPSKDNFVIASDTRGHLRLFRHPCYDTQQAFYEARPSSAAVNCCRFLPAPRNPSASGGAMFVSSSVDGSICLWALE